MVSFKKEEIGGISVLTSKLFCYFPRWTRRIKQDWFLSSKRSTWEFLHTFRESSIREDNYLRIALEAFFFVKRCIYIYIRSCLIKFQNCLTSKSKSPFQNLPRTLPQPNFRSKGFRNFQEGMFSNLLLAESWPGYIFWERSARSFSNLKDLNLDSFPCQAHELPKGSTLNHAHCSTTADFDIPSNFFLATFRFWQRWCIRDAPTIFFFFFFD